MQSDRPRPHSLTYTPHADPSRGVYLTLTPTTFFSFISIGIGTGSAVYSCAMHDDFLAFLTWFGAVFVAAVQAVFAFAITPRSILSARTTWADQALVAAVWIFGFGASALAVRGW